MKNRLGVLVVLLVALALPPTALAQGSGSTGGSYPASNYSVTRSLTATIAEIYADENVLVIREENGERFQLRLDKKTKFKADKKTELRGKKNLSLSDFKVGQTVKVKYRPDEGRVTEVRLKYVKPEKKEEASG